MFNYQSEVIDFLKENASEKKRLFDAKLTPNSNLKYGIKLPDLRKLAKKIAQSSKSADEFFKVAQDHSDEELTLQGLVLASLRTPLNTIIPHLVTFIPKISTWAICDSSCFRVPDTEKAQLWDFLSKYFQSDREFEARFGIVMGMQNFIEDDFIKPYLAQLLQNTHPEYYVRMAIAWAISFAFIGYPDLVWPIFENHQLPKETEKMAARKCYDSFRIPDKTKSKLRNVVT